MYLKLLDSIAFCGCPPDFESEKGRSIIQLVPRKETKGWIHCESTHAVHHCISVWLRHQLAHLGGGHRKNYMLLLVLFFGVIRADVDLFVRLWFGISQTIWWYWLNCNYVTKQSLEILEILEMMVVRGTPLKARKPPSFRLLNHHTSATDKPQVFFFCHMVLAPPKFPGLNLFPTNTNPARYRGLEDFSTCQFVISRYPVPLW